MKKKLFKFKDSDQYIKIGQKCFYLGTLLLSTTNFFAVFFYLVSLLISLTIKTNPFNKDKWNLSLLICTIVLIFSSINISIIQNHNPTYEVLKNMSWNPSSIWVGLFNWIPYFLAFSGFQIYLKTECQRIRVTKCLILGIIPVIISILLQYWFQIYGPFKYLNGLVVFYLKPIQELGGYAGLFSNPNYAGLWLSASLPFCFLIPEIFKVNNKNKKIQFGVAYSIIISTIYCILCTNSRNSLVGIIIATALMISTKVLLISLLILGFIYFLLLEIGTLPFLGSLGIKEILPSTIFSKLFQTNYLNKFQFSRIDIWQNAINLINERPLFGWGAATFPILYLIKGGIEDAQHTHSLPLEISQTHGLPVSIILTLFVSLLLFKASKIIFINNGYSNSKINKAWITSLLIIVISHISDVTYYDGRVSLLIWILITGLKCILDEDKIKNKII